MIARGFAFNSLTPGASESSWHNFVVRMKLGYKQNYREEKYCIQKVHLSSGVARKCRGFYKVFK